jgi:methyl coenzyme M reductase subunit C-like uncharacterized protein (methanogenesis marker protein 7)
MLLQTPWRRRKILSGQPFHRVPHDVANIAQYFRSIGHRQSLIGGDGINKTMV